MSKKAYRGINVFLLSAAGFASPFWLTFNQVQSLDGRVKKGEKACPVVFWKPMMIEDKETGKERQIPLLRFYHVFNHAQCESLEDAVPTATEIEPSVQTKPEEIVSMMAKRPTIKHGFIKAFYSPTDDCVGMPARERFDKEEGYYCALFHELIHSTGHETRLNRITLTEKAGFGSDPYCKEELIAELGAAFLCGQAEIVERTIDNSAAYLQGWLDMVRNDRKLIVHAAAQAQKAADYILGQNPVESPVSDKGMVPEPMEVLA